MKKFILFLLAVVISLELNAQFRQMPSKVADQKDLISNNNHQRSAHWRSVDAYNKNVLQGQTSSTKARLDSIIDNGQYQYLETFAYDTLQQAIEYVDSYWENGAWHPSWKELYAYYPNKLLSEIIEHEWDDSLNLWKPLRKFNYTYNSDGSMQQFICFDWDPSASQWIFYTKNVFDYNAQNLLEAEIQFGWQSNAWVYEWKEEYEYNALDDLSMVYYKYWDGNQWKSMNKTEYLYDTNFLLAERMVYYWQEFTFSWINSSKYVFSYNAVNLLSQEIYYSWNSTNNMFEPYGKTNYTYNVIADLDTMTQFYWTGTAWQYEDKIILTHDAQYSYQDLLLPPLFFNDEMAFLMSHKLDHYLALEFDDPTWAVDIDATLYYTLVNVFGQIEHTQQAISVYPNPTSTWLQVQGLNEQRGTLEIYNLNGACIINQPVSNPLIYVGNLAKGMYIWKYSGGETNAHGKFIIN